MWEVNKEYVKPFISYHADEDFDVDLWGLRMTVEGFSLHGDFSRVLRFSAERKNPRLFLEERDPQTYFLVEGINNLSGIDLDKKLPGYTLNLKGMVIPHEQLELLGSLGLRLPEIRKTDFRTGPVIEGQSFAVRTRPYEGRDERVDYVISPEHRQLGDIVTNLGGPNDLLMMMPF